MYRDSPRDPTFGCFLSGFNILPGRAANLRRRQFSVFYCSLIDL